jgi:hypothetical protein
MINLHFFTNSSNVLFSNEFSSYFQFSMFCQHFDLISIFFEIGEAAQWTDVAAHASVLIKHEFCSTHEDRGKIGLQHRDSIAKDQIDSWFYFLEKDGYIARTKGKILILPATDEKLKDLQDMLAAYLPELVHTDHSDRFLPLRPASTEQLSRHGLGRHDSRMNLSSPFHRGSSSSNGDDSSSNGSAGKRDDFSDGSEEDSTLSPEEMKLAQVAMVYSQMGEWVMDPTSPKHGSGLRHRTVDEKADE